jgi:hypothetical protein
VQDQKRELRLLRPISCIPKSIPGLEFSYYTYWKLSCVEAIPSTHASYWITTETETTASPTITTSIIKQTKFEGHLTFEVEKWVLDGFILGRNWQFCRIKAFPQENFDFLIDSRRFVPLLIRCNFSWILKELSFCLGKGLV